MSIEANALAFLVGAKIVENRMAAENREDLEELVNELRKEIAIKQEKILDMTAGKNAMLALVNEMVEELANSTKPKTVADPANKDARQKYYEQKKIEQRERFKKG